MNNPTEELAAVLATVRPGQRIHGTTLLRARPVDPATAAILRDAPRLARVIQETPELNRLACAELPPVVPTVRIIRRRFTDTERLSAAVDLNNLLWTLRFPDVPPLLLQLKEWGVRDLHGFGDATLPAVLESAGNGTAHSFPRGVLLSAGPGEILSTLTIAPAGTSADQLILDHVRAERTMIISNDRFREWRRQYPDLRRHLWRLRCPVHYDPGDPRGFALQDWAIELRNGPASCHTSR